MAERAIQAGQSEGRYTVRCYHCPATQVACIAPRWGGNHDTASATLCFKARGWRRGGGKNRNWSCLMCAQCWEPEPLPEAPCGCVRIAIALPDVDRIDAVVEDLHES